MNILEIVVTIIDMIVEALCVSGFILCTLKLINKSLLIVNKKSIICFFAIFLVIATISKFLHIVVPNLNWLKSIILIVFSTIGAKIFLKARFYKSVIATIIYLSFSAILEIAIALLLNSIGVFPETIFSNVYYNSLFAIALSIIELIIIQIIYSLNISLSGIENKLKYFLPQLIAIIVCLFPTMMLLTINHFKYSLLFVVANLIQLFAVALVGMYNLKFVIKHENTEQQLENTIIYNETLSKVNEGVRGFKHDMGNIVQAILGYIAINDTEGVKKYCQNLVLGFNDINVLSILSPKVIDDPAIYGVVVNKILLAREKNLTLSLDVNVNVSDINFPKFELSRILGILIDNAIEASEITEDKKLTINMRHDYDKNKDVIVVANSINNINMDTKKIFEKNYSTKENPSGFGLYEVNKFIKQNPQSYITTSIDKHQKLFTQTFNIYSKPKETIDELEKTNTVA